jgi:hypothetical protein
MVRRASCGKSSLHPRACEPALTRVCFGRCCRRLWETLMSPNFGLGNAQKQEKEHEEEPPRKLSSQVVPIHRYLCIHAHTLGHWALAKKKGASSLHWLPECLGRSQHV